MSLRQNRTFSAYFLLDGILGTLLILMVAGGLAFSYQSLSIGLQKSTERLEILLEKKNDSPLKAYY